MSCDDLILNVSLSFRSSIFDELFKLISRLNLMMNITKIIAAATRDYEVPIALLETNKIRQMSKMFIQVVLRDRVKSLTKVCESLLI
ncbi:unnamed protein product [Brassica rapa subsp. trilocularis]